MVCIYHTLNHHKVLECTFPCTFAKGFLASSTIGPSDLVVNSAPDWSIQKMNEMHRLLIGKIMTSSEGPLSRAHVLRRV